MTRKANLERDKMGIDIEAATGNMRHDLAVGDSGVDFALKIFSETHQVKNDIQMLNTGRVFIEYQHNPGGRGWESSGIATSSADWWTIVIDGVASISLRTQAVRDIGREWVRSHGHLPSYKDESCHARGAVIPLGELVSRAAAWQQVRIS